MSLFEPSTSISNLTERQIETHKKVIDWCQKQRQPSVYWIDCETLWAHKTNNPDWETYVLYLQDDEFAEYRIALAQNETIQVKCGNEWKDAELKPTDDFNKYCNYRIKPEIAKSVIDKVFDSIDDVKDLKNSVEVLNQG